VPLDHHGRIPVNFSDERHYLDRMDNLSNQLLKKDGDNARVIKPGDYVVVLPLMYTGNIDYVETPIGRIPGGYIPVSIINSVLTEKWLTPLNYGIEIIFLAVLIAWGLARIQSVKRYLLSIIATFVSLV